MPRSALESECREAGKPNPLLVLQSAAANSNPGMFPGSFACARSTLVGEAGGAMVSLGGSIAQARLKHIPHVTIVGQHGTGQLLDGGVFVTFQPSRVARHAAARLAGENLGNADRLVGRGV